ncbi:hypothetical protein COLO4_07355 [Corchorus olitorius]|uniref:Uncharacterized protein n=1 Tax=Corchorus olitorius TaxID=93759 RepID=A0A1R3KK45_9ROSI|nr:hypothetical protein COLO4_07355 [Corchorus olitorius]
MKPKFPFFLSSFPFTQSKNHRLSSQHHRSPISDDSLSDHFQIWRDKFSIH